MAKLQSQRRKRQRAEDCSTLTVSSVVRAIFSKVSLMSKNPSHICSLITIQKMCGYALFTVLSFSSFTISGCSLFGLEEQSVKVDDKGTGTRADRRKKEEVVTEEKEEEFTYNPIGKRDPFRSFLAFASDNSIIDNIPRTPLQRYDIEQYTLTGIISGIDRPRALVEDPTGIGHVMELGDYIGTNWGKVTSIDGDTVIITEEYKTIEDELVTRPIKLTLRNTSNNSGM